MMDDAHERWTGNPTCSNHGGIVGTTSPDMAYRCVRSFRPCSAYSAPNRRLAKRGAPNVTTAPGVTSCECANELATRMAHTPPAECPANTVRSSMQRSSAGACKIADVRSAKPRCTVAAWGCRGGHRQASARRSSATSCFVRVPGKQTMDGCRAVAGKCSYGVSAASRSVAIRRVRDGVICIRMHYRT